MCVFNSVHHEDAGGADVFDGPVLHIGADRNAFSCDGAAFGQLGSHAVDLTCRDLKLKGKAAISFANGVGTGKGCRCVHCSKGGGNAEDGEDQCTENEQDP